MNSTAKDDGMPDFEDVNGIEVRLDDMKEDDDLGIEFQVDADDQKNDEQEFPDFARSKDFQGSLFVDRDEEDEDD